MRKSKFLLLLLIPLFAHARGGTDVGNGSDEVPLEQGSAWFFGSNRTVQACLSVSSRFGVSKEQAAAAVKTAFGKWTGYIEANSKTLYQSNRWAFSRRLDVSLECRGGEDLRIFLGIDTPETAKAREEFFHPLAFSKRTSFDARTGWGQGFLWVRNPEPENGAPFPDWSAKYALDYILLHELGHIFGNPHVPGTIMTENMPHILHNTLLPEPQIDLRQPLYSLFPSGGTYLLGMHPTQDDLDRVVSRIVGRNLDDNTLRCRAEVSPVRNEVGADSGLRIDLTCRDRDGEVRYAVQSTDAPTLETNDGSIRLFKRARMSSTGQAEGMWEQRLTPVPRIGAITLKDGSRIGVLIEFLTVWSEEPTTLRISVIDGGQKTLLFYGPRRP